MGTVFAAPKINQKIKLNQEPNQILINSTQKHFHFPTQTPQQPTMAATTVQTFETESTVTTFEVKTMSEVTEERVEETSPVVEMRKVPTINAVEDSIRRHTGDKVVELIYWKDIKKSAAVAASSLLLLIALSIFSVLTVVSYISLTVLTVTFSYAVYKRTLAAVQKSNEGHPFGQYLEMDLSISPEKAQEYAEITSSYMATYVGELRRLVLVEDMIDSIKFGIFLWVMTYVGAWFNGLTLLILGLVSMFSLPKTYEVYQEQIDAYLALAQDQVKGIMAQAKTYRAQLPALVAETSEHYIALLKKQMPNDLDEAKEMALKLYDSVVELIHAKIPIGKKDQ